MNDEDYNKIIEKLATKINEDNLSYDEQNPETLKQYYDYVKTNFDIEGDNATELINEAFLYLKLKNAGDVDPLQEGDKFGAGFS